jgi:hypothetical protein
MNQTNKGDLESSSPILFSISSKLLVILALCFLLLTGWLYYQISAYNRLLSEKCSYGIIELQLAGNGAKTATIITAWQNWTIAPKQEVGSIASGRNGLELIKASQKRDWWLIASYTITLCIFTLLSSIFRSSSVSVRTVLVSLAVAPGIFDLIENTIIFFFLRNPANEELLKTWTPLMTLSAGLKFVALYSATATITYLISHQLMARYARLNGENDLKVLKSHDEVLNDELKYVQFRRIKAGVDKGQPLTGLASSGGGIRSATVNLGVLEKIMDAGLLRHIDYHTTVSGGGYVGSALASLISFNEDGTDPDIFNTPRPKGGFAPQYIFKKDQAAYFDVSRPDRYPLHTTASGINNNYPLRLSRQMVLDHLRAFGEFLVRKRRLLSRDVLRAVGTIITGILATFFMFMLALLMTSSVLYGLLSLTSQGQQCLNSLLTTVVCDNYFTTYALPGAFPGFLCGAVACLILLLIQKSLQKILPESFFIRHGDTREECYQSRTLWVFGGITIGTAFIVATVIPGETGLFLPVFFGAGSSLVALCVYLLSSFTDDTLMFFIASPDNLSKGFRSLLSATLGLCLAISLFLLLVGLLPLFTSLLLNPEATSDGPRIPNTTTTIIGLIATILSGIITWSKKLSPEKEKRQEFSYLMGKIKKYLIATKKFVIAIPVLVVFLLFFIFAGSMSIWMVQSWLVEVPDVVNYLLNGGCFALILSLVGVVFDFNKLSLHYFYRDRLVEAYLTTYGAARQNSTHLEVKRENMEMLLAELHGVPESSIPLHGPKVRRSGSCSTIVQKVVDQEAVAKSMKIFESLILDNSMFKIFLSTTAANSMRVLFSKIPKFSRKIGTIVICEAATSAPYHLFCACLNLNTDRDMKLRTRKSDIFIFSKLYCGSPTTEYMPTRNYRSGTTKVARAMTISGAAIDSSLGRNTFFAQSFAATLFNVRLGQWLENPGYKKGRYAHWNEDVVFWPFYLMLEALGISDNRRRLIRLSDGGHTGDNLGLISLFQRRCRLIISVDAEADPNYSFGSLMNVLGYLEVDTRTRVQFNLEKIHPEQQTGLCELPFTIGSIEYMDDNGMITCRGCIIIIKSAVTPDMTELLRKHKSKYPAFPQETTADQFFSEDQFEAYRCLGREMAIILLRAIPSLATGTIDCSKILSEYDAWLLTRKLQG